MAKLRGNLPGRARLALRKIEEPAPSGYVAVKFRLIQGGKVTVAGALARTHTRGLGGIFREYFCNQLGKLLIK